MTRAALLLVLAPFVWACGTPMPVGQRVPDAVVSVEGAEVAPFDSTALNFLVVGDWGRNGFFNQASVAEAMGAIGAGLGTEFTISTGDNFYLAGVTDVDDPKWERSYEAIYTAPVLQSRWYATLGNHDWQGNVPAQIGYTETSERWYLPAQYYAETLAVNDDTDVLFVFIDTTPLAYPAEYQRRFSDTGDWDVDDQMAWLERTLDESDAAWKVVVGHHPIYVGSIRYSDNERLIERLVPVFERTGVQVYFAGHDHNLQHHRPVNSPIDYFVSGAGSLTREVIETPNTLFALRKPGFMAVSLTPTRMTVRSYTDDYEMVYTADVPISRGTRLDLPFGLGGD
ncbi:purple acid phosphatase family protein [Rubrivirga sp. IMCC43871]|uniref:purple acid phosphatase family protein n=1 Tax=Rubrivirga sp. IMCC43871 TaxID=3391575 RepID=UPI00398FDCDC